LDTCYKIGGGVIAMVNAFQWMVFLIGLAVVIGSIMATSASNPILFIDSPPDGESFDYNNITVSGHARCTDYAVLKSVMVKDVLATGTILWHANISLHDGSNLITVVATDDMGQSSSETITVYYQALITPPIQLPRYDGAPSAIPTPTPPPTGSISITTIPSGAEVYLDDSPTKKNTNITLENVTVGYHEIKVTKEGFESKTEYKYVRAGRTEELDFVLEPLTGSIYVYSTPPGASVYLDNVYKRDTNTNCTLSEVAVGRHSIKLTKSGYFDETIKSVLADGPLSLHVTLRRCSYINISSKPPGANVSLDGNDTGETTPANISVALGNHTIKLTKFGYSNNKTKVDVSVAKTYHVNVNLSGGYGYIDIDSDPDGASVYLDDKYTRTKTPTNISKVVGNYSIILRKLEYKEVTKDISVSAGKTTLVTEGLSLTFWKRYGGLVMLIVTVFVAIFELPIYIILERKKRNK
jgi:hypothetical protein